MGDVTLADICAALGGVLHGAPETCIVRIAALDGATGDSIAFVAQARFAPLIARSEAAALIVAPEYVAAASARGPCIETPDPYLYYARLTQWWRARQRGTLAAASAIHPSAIVDPCARLGAGCSVGPLAVIDAGAEIGAGCSIGPHCVIGAGASVGPDSRLAAHVVLGAGCTLGARAVLHSGVVIGADGFGFAPHQGRWEKIEQLGSVRIGAEVEIGANSCIDRGALGDTLLGDGVKLDNLVQIGHNVQVGAHTAMAGCVGVAGSARIGAHCTIGGGAVVLGHLELADHVHISAASVVMRSILKAGHYSGIFPIDENTAWEKNAATLRQLHTLRQRLKALEGQDRT